MASISKYTDKNGETFYKVRVYVGKDPITGKDKYKSQSKLKNKKAANQAAARIQLDLKRETHRSKQCKTYQDIYDLWIEQYEHTVEESTFVKTTGIFKNHILPKMKDYRIDKIDYKTCKKHVYEWSDKLKNFRMVKSYAAKVLDFAIRHGHIQMNPFSLVEMPVKRKEITLDQVEHKNVYTEEQLKHFIKCMEQESNVKAYTLFRLLAFSGCRKGEAFALTWQDVDFETNEIRITKAISRGKNVEYPLYLKPTKNRKNRTVSMDVKTMDILKKWKERQKEQLHVLGFKNLKPSQLVFSNEKNEFLQPTKTYKWLEHVLKKYNLPKITTHGLRHTHTSVLLEKKVEPKVVQERLGHSDIGTTMNTYAHASKESHKKVADILEAIVEE